MSKKIKLIITTIVGMLILTGVAVTATLNERTRPEPNDTVQENTIEEKSTTQNNEVNSNNPSTEVEKSIPNRDNTQEEASRTDNFSKESPKSLAVIKDSLQKEAYSKSELTSCEGELIGEEYTSGNKSISFSNTNILAEINNPATQEIELFLTGERETLSSEQIDYSTQFDPQLHFQTLSYIDLVRGTRLPCGILGIGSFSVSPYSITENVYGFSSQNVYGLFGKVDGEYMLYLTEVDSAKIQSYTEFADECKQVTAEPYLAEVCLNQKLGESESYLTLMEQEIKSSYRSIDN